MTKYDDLYAQAEAAEEAGHFTEAAKLYERADEARQDQLAGLLALDQALDANEAGTPTGETLPCCYCGRDVPVKEQASPGWVDPEKGKVTNCVTCSGEGVRTNRERRRQAQRLLNLYWHEVNGGVLPSEEVEDTITDAISDLYHLATSLGIDLDALHEKAFQHVGDEVNGRAL